MRTAVCERRTPEVILQNVPQRRLAQYIRVLQDRSTENESNTARYCMTHTGSLMALKSSTDVKYRSFASLTATIALYGVILRQWTFRVTTQTDCHRSRSCKNRTKWCVSRL